VSIIFLTFLRIWERDAKWCFEFEEGWFIVLSTATSSIFLFRSCRFSLNFFFSILHKHHSSNPPFRSVLAVWRGEREGKREREGERERESGDRERWRRKIFGFVAWKILSLDDDFWVREMKEMNKGVEGWIIKISN
jgi:hypothetical protein